MNWIGSYNYMLETKNCCSSGCIVWHTEKLFKILQLNMFNQKVKSPMDCTKGDDVFGLRCFIDSVYWGYVEDLQKNLDDWYSKVVRNGHECYDYKTSNFMAANVHITLSMALMKMMDACECLMFVDSDNSLKYQKGQTKTPSPWIYEEMGFAKKLRINIPERHKKDFSISVNESRRESSISLICFSSTEPRKANFTYNVDMRDFAELKIGDFQAAMGKKGVYVLDYWYRKYDA